MNQASNRLCNNEVRDTLHALQCIIAQCREEEALAKTYGSADGIGGLKDVSQAAHTCLNEYLFVLRKAKEMLYADWSQSDNAEVRRIAEAAQSGDWSGLAI